jgi:hypothetical protein
MKKTRKKRIIPKVLIYPIKMKKGRAYYMRGAAQDQAEACAKVLGLEVERIPMCGTAFYDCYRRALGRGTPDDCAGCGAKYTAFVLYDPADLLGGCAFSASRQEFFRKHIISKDNPRRLPDMPGTP